MTSVDRDTSPVPVTGSAADAAAVDDDVRGDEVGAGNTRRVLLFEAPDNHTRPTTVL